MDLQIDIPLLSTENAPTVERVVDSVSELTMTKRPQADDATSVAGTIADLTTGVGVQAWQLVLVGVLVGVLDGTTPEAKNYARSLIIGAVENAVLKLQEQGIYLNGAAFETWKGGAVHGTPVQSVQR